MKRHPALIPLSHDHRQGLFLAQIMKRGVPRFQEAPATPAAKRDYALSTYTVLLCPHFTTEEEILAPLVRGIDPQIDLLLTRLFAEHLDLHARFQALAAADPVDTEAVEEQLDALGLLLEGHIRMEERQLFQHMQAVLDAEIFAALHTRLAR